MLVFQGVEGSFLFSGHLPCQEPERVVLQTGTASFDAKPNLVWYDIFFLYWSVLISWFAVLVVSFARMPRVMKKKGIVGICPE